MFDIIQHGCGIWIVIFNWSYGALKISGVDVFENYICSIYLVLYSLSRSDHKPKIVEVRNYIFGDAE